MNRKRKKQMTTVGVLLFFLVAGVWYFVCSGEFPGKQNSSAELTGVLDNVAVEVLPTHVAEEVTSEIKKENTAELIVYVCGAVNNPGIYALETNSRLYEAIAMAGGFSAEADPAYHNLARSISDGERIYILSCAETKLLTTEQFLDGEDGTNGISQETNGLINLNTATAEQLKQLPGIGEAKAASILEYRQKIGHFTDIEEIMNVSGIGEAMFEKIKNKITVK